MIEFFLKACKTKSKRSTFGLCDDPISPGEKGKPAYIDEANGQNWIGTVDNYYQDTIDFFAIDHCVKFPPLPNGDSSKRCDGVLVCQELVAFVELKVRDEHGAKWVKDAEKQLLVTIEKFEATPQATHFKSKRAYIVNSMRPQSRTGQAASMEEFYDITDYVLFIKARIALYSTEG